MGGRFNVSSTIPVHGAGPWVIVETPPDTTPGDAGDPSRVVFAWMVRASKDSSTVAGAHLRWLGSHARGDPQKQRRHHARDSTRVLRKPASFLCAYTSILRRSRAADSATKLTTSDQARRIAANHAKLPRLLAGRPASRKNLKPYCLRGSISLRARRAGRQRPSKPAVATRVPQWKAPSAGGHAWGRVRTGKRGDGGACRC
jgi:hypothetical protein